jgi:chromosome segregation ATPase
MSDQLTTTIERLVTEIIELRYGKAEDPEGALDHEAGDTPEEVIHMLSRIRARSDRIEELQSQIRRIKGRLTRSQMDAQLEAEIKRDEAFVKNRASRVQEFTSSDERKADAALDSINEKRAAVAAKRLVDYVQEAYELADQARWSLSAYRQDLRAQLHAMQVVRSMEYTSAPSGDWREGRGIS